MKKKKDHHKKLGLFSMLKDTVGMIQEMNNTEKEFSNSGSELRNKKRRKRKNRTNNDSRFSIKISKPNEESQVIKKNILKNTSSDCSNNSFESITEATLNSFKLKDLSETQNCSNPSLNLSFGVYEKDQTNSECNSFVNSQFLSVDKQIKGVSIHLWKNRQNKQSSTFHKRYSVPMNKQEVFCFSKND